MQSKTTIAAFFITAITFCSCTVRKEASVIAYQIYQSGKMEMILKTDSGDTIAWRVRTKGVYEGGRYNVYFRNDKITYIRKIN